MVYQLTNKIISEESTFMDWLKCTIYIYISFRFLAIPIGHAYGLRARPSTPPINNQVLEKAFYHHRKIAPKNDQLQV